MNSTKLRPAKKPAVISRAPFKTEPVTFYWAYGSNLNFRGMAVRCPSARPYRKLYATDGQLVFRSVADVEKHEGKRIPGGLWRITPRCERALDRYEGVEGGFYVKRYLWFVDNQGQRQRALYYKMGRGAGGIMPPSEGYLNTIIDGYRDFGLELYELDEAVQRSWMDKNLNPELRARYLRKGKPILAQADHVPLVELVDDMVGYEGEEDDEDEGETV